MRYQKLWITLRAITFDIALQNFDWKFFLLDFHEMHGKKFIKFHGKKFLINFFSNFFSRSKFWLKFFCSFSMKCMEKISWFFLKIFFDIFSYLLWVPVVSVISCTEGYNKNINRAAQWHGYIALGHLDIALGASALVQYQDALGAIYSVSPRCPVNIL